MPILSPQVHRRSKSAQKPKATNQSTTASSKPECSPDKTPYLFDNPWKDIQVSDLLEIKIGELRALANAMYCVSLVAEDDMIHQYLFREKKITKPAAFEELGPLNLLSQRLCDEILDQVRDLSCQSGK